MAPAVAAACRITGAIESLPRTHIIDRTCLYKHLHFVTGILTSEALATCWDYGATVFCGEWFETAAQGPLGLACKHEFGAHMTQNTNTWRHRQAISSTSLEAPQTPAQIWNVLLGVAGVSQTSEIILPTVLLYVSTWGAPVSIFSCPVKVMCYFWEVGDSCATD